MELGHAQELGLREFESVSSRNKWGVDFGLGHVQELYLREFESVSSRNKWGVDFGVPGVLGTGGVIATEHNPPSSHFDPMDFGG